MKSSKSAGIHVRLVPKSWAQAARSLAERGDMGKAALPGCQVKGSRRRRDCDEYDIDE